MRLYELADQYQALKDIDDMDPEAIADTLEALEGDIQQKAKAIVAVRAGMEASVNAIDAEIKRLADMKKTVLNRETRLRDYLKTNMQRTEISNIKCDFFSITLANGRPALHIFDETAIPDEYMNVKTTVTPERKAILDALKAGEEIPGCQIVTSEPSLRIK